MHACTSLTGMVNYFTLWLQKAGGNAAGGTSFYVPSWSSNTRDATWKAAGPECSSGAGDDKRTCKVGVSLCCVILCPLNCDSSILTRTTNIQSACRTCIISRCLKLHRARVTPPSALGIDPTHLQARNAECPAHSAVVLGIIPSPRRAILREASLLQHSHRT